MEKLKIQTPEMTALLKQAGSQNYEVAVAAQRQVAKALALPLQQGVLNGDITADIFEPYKFEDGTSVEYPLDFLQPGTERDFVAYTIPNTGALPQKHVEGDFVTVSTFDIGAAIDTHLKYLRDGRWDIMGRMLQVIEAMFVRKNNDDAWRTILAAGANRNLQGYDDQATAGLFTKRLVSILEILMRRNAGGNSTSLGRGKLTDLYVSPEGKADALSWDLTQIPDAIRTKLYMDWADGGVGKIGDVKIHSLDELGVNQSYNNYFDFDLGGSFSSDKVELVVGLDLFNRDSFVHPIRAFAEIFEDPTFHRARRVGLYGWAEHGWSVLYNKRVILGSF